MASGSRRQAGRTSSISGSSTSSSISSQMKMKLIVDSNSRVVYAEVGKDVVDYLFNLLTLPLGTIVKLLRDSNVSMVGCVGKLYRSVEKLDNHYICQNDAMAAKNALLRPTVNYQSANLLLLTNGSSSSSSNSRSSTNCSGYVDGKVIYHVMDNLEVTPPYSIPAIIDLLKTSRNLSEKNVQLGPNEGLQILNASLQSKTVLTDVFLRRTSRSALTAS